MNKFLSKIVGVALGLTMAIGVSVAVGSNTNKAMTASAQEIATTLSWTSQCGGKGTGTEGESWTVTSDGTESNFSTDLGIHYGTSNASVTYIQCETSGIEGTVTKIVVNCSGNNTPSLSAKIGGTDLSAVKTGITTSNAAYTFTGSQTASSTKPVVVKLYKSGKYLKALYVKSIEVTYDNGETGETSIKTYSDIEEASYKIVYRRNNSNVNYYMTTSLDTSSRFTASTTASNAGIFTFTSAGASNKWYLSYDNNGTKTYLKPGTSNGSNVRSTSTEGMELTASAGVNGNIRLAAGTTTDYLQLNGTSGNDFVGRYTGGQRDIYQLIEVPVPASVTIRYSGQTSLEYNGSRTQTISMTAEAAGIKGTINYVWSSSNSNCLALTSGSGTSNATFTIRSAGNASVTVIAKVGNDTKATSDPIVFTITNKTFSGVLTITSSATINIDLEESSEISYTLTGNTNVMDIVTTSSDDETVVAFDENDPLTYYPVGNDGDTTTITLTLSSSTNDLETYSVSQLITITSGVPVTGIDITNATRTVKLGGNAANLYAVISPENATNKNVVWESSDTSVVTVTNGGFDNQGRSIGVLAGVNVGVAIVTAKSDYDNLIQDTCTVTVTGPDDKALESISIVTGSSYKKRYSEEDTTVDTTGLSIGAHYISPTIETYDETTNIAAGAAGVVWTLDLANFKIIATYGGKTAELPISVVHEFAKNKGEYRLTESNTLQAGDHIAIGGVAVATGKDWSGNDFVMSNQAANNVQGAQITVSSKKIIADDESDNTDKTAVYDIELVEGAVDGSFALKVGTKYLGNGSSSNQLKPSDDITKNTSFSFTYDSTIKLWKIVCLSEVTNARNYMYINANSGSTNRLFACYENKEVNGELPADYNYLKVYKFEYYVDEANDYAKSFNEANVCGTNINTKAIASKWSEQASAFASLTLGAQNLFTTGTGTGSEFTECLERYDRVQYLYYNTDLRTTYNDFMGRVSAGQVDPRNPMGLLGTFNDFKNNGAIVIIATISLLSAITISGYFFLKKRKEQ